MTGAACRFILPTVLRPRKCRRRRSAAATATGWRASWSWTVLTRRVRSRRTPSVRTGSRCTTSRMMMKQHRFSPPKRLTSCSWIFRSKTRSSSLQRSDVRRQPAEGRRSSRLSIAPRPPSAVVLGRPASISSSCALARRPLSSSTCRECFDEARFRRSSPLLISHRHCNDRRADASSRCGHEAR